MAGGDAFVQARGVIDLVLAHGDIGGSISAESEIQAVHAAGTIAAAITAPVVSSVVDWTRCCWQILRR